MKPEGRKRPGAVKDKHILICLDESENSKRALLYAADMLGGLPGFRVTLLSIIPEPSDDYLESGADRSTWIESSRSKVIRQLENFRKVLVQAGFREQKVDIIMEVSYCPSVADCILDIQRRLECCTVVLGRRGISKREEILFGSTSNSILHAEKKCAVWIVD